MNTGNPYAMGELLESLRARVAELERDRELNIEAMRGISSENNLLAAENTRLREALVRLRDCDWVITPADRMDAVRAIARAALEVKP